MIYDDDSSGSEYGIMMDSIITGPNYDFEQSSYEGALVENLGGMSVNKAESAGIEGSTWVYNRNTDGEFITWVSPFNGRNQLQDINMAYGNEYTAGYIYCSPCLIVCIADASDRVYR